MLGTFLAFVEAQTNLGAWSPDDIVKIVNAIFSNLGTLLTAIIGGYVLVINSRQKRTEERAEKNSIKIGEVQSDMKLVERNTNSMTATVERLAKKEGEGIGADKATAIAEELARTLAQGQREGRETASGAIANQSNNSPAPVIDETVTAAVDKVSEAIENSAKATEHVAKATEKKK